MKRYEGSDQTEIKDFYRLTMDTDITGDDATSPTIATSPEISQTSPRIRPTSPGISQTTSVASPTSPTSPTITTITTNSTSSGSSPPTPTSPCRNPTTPSPLSPVSPLSPLSPLIPSFVFDTPDLTQPDDFCDVTLVVEGGTRRLYTCRGILASASPVWRRMFTGDFRERRAEEIPLPGKSFTEMHELLLCISPAIQKPITGDNVMEILPLADEYQMLKLKSDCERWLLNQLTHVAGPPLQQLCVAQQYGLGQLLEHAVELAAALPGPQLEEAADYQHLTQDTHLRILRRRVCVLEAKQKTLSRQNESWRKKCEELEDCLKKMSREKLTIKRALDDVEAAWELKGSDARCIDPVHIYGPRDLSCPTCTKQMQTYIQGKLHFLLNRGSTWSGITWPQ